MKSTNEKIIGYGAYILSAIFLIAGYMSHDIPSYEIDYLTGVKALLHNALLVYLPAFPLVSGLVVIGLASNVNAKVITGANLGLTVLFLIFAIADSVLVHSWILVTIASVFPFIASVRDRAFRRY